MAKNQSTDTKGVNNTHELVMDVLLRLVALLLQILKNHNQHLIESQSNEPIWELSMHELGILYSESFFEKMLKENYGFNNFKAIRRILIWVCTNNDARSEKIITEVLKHLNYYLSENIAGYLECIKVLALIEDSYTEFRRDLIFGVPTVLFEQDYYTQVNRYGLGVHKSLKKPSMSFVSPVQKDTYTSCFLKVIVDTSEKNESNCFMMLTYLVMMLNSSQDIFTTLVAYPSPSSLYQNFYDWIFAFVKEYLEKDRKFNSSYSDYKYSRLYHSTMKEQLLLLEDHILK